jgi:hypothetical protein
MHQRSSHPHILTWNGVIEDEAEEKGNEHAGGEEDGDDLVQHGGSRLDGASTWALHPLQHQLHVLYTLSVKWISFYVL